MHAVILDEYGGPEKLHSSEIPVPPVGSNDVLVRVQASGVCFRDVLERRGWMRGLQLPRILGHEIAGIVTQVGSEVRNFRPGDRVCATQHRSVCCQCSYCRNGKESFCQRATLLGHDCDGGYAEYVVIGAENVVLLPAEVSFEEGAVAACAVGTALNAVRDVAHIVPGDVVLVTGAGGGVGIHAVQVARLCGAEVIAITTSERKRPLLEQLGAHVILSDGSFAEQVRTQSPKGGVDAVIDTVGGSVFDQVRRTVLPGCRWVVVGEVGKSAVQFNLGQLIVHGFSLLAADGTTRAQLTDTVQLLARGSVRALIGLRASLEDVADVHRALEKKAVTGRAVLTFS